MSYNQSFTPLARYNDTSLDLVFKYPGGQINFRSFLVVNEAENLPLVFFRGTALAERCVLFGLLARDSDGVPLFPRRFGTENALEDARVATEYGKYDGILIAEIAQEVGLLERIKAQLRAFNELVTRGSDEDEKDPEDVLSIREIRADVARQMGYNPREIGFWDLLDLGEILASYRRESESYKKPKRSVWRDNRSAEQQKSKRGR